MIIQNSEEIVLAIPDTQLPFHHRDSIEFLTEVKKKFKPTRVVHLGDFFDCHALSRYVRNPNGMSASEELHAAQQTAKEYYKLFPKADLVHSNHDIRVYKRAEEVGISAGYLKDYHEWMQFPPGWKIHQDITIDNVLYTHGEGYSGSGAQEKIAHDKGMSVVFGHLHSHAGIKYVSTKDKLLFGFNAGCLIDRHAYAFEYGAHSRYKPILGAALIVRGIPIFIPMLLCKNRRWVGELCG